MSRKKMAAAVIAVLILIGAGYAGIQYYLDNIKLPEVSPRQVVGQYFAALEQGDYTQAYALVDKVHYHESINQFTDRVSMYAPDMTMEIGEEEIRENKAVVAVHIVVPMKFGLYESDTEMSLVRAKREWKILHP